MNIATLARLPRRNTRRPSVADSKSYGIPPVDGFSSELALVLRVKLPQWSEPARSMGIDLEEDRKMAKRHTPEDIVLKLRQLDVVDIAEQHSRGRDPLDRRD